MKTGCSHGIRAEEGSEEAWSVRNALSMALKGLTWKAGEGFQGLLRLWDLRSMCVHFSDSPRGFLDLAVPPLPTGKTSTR